MGRVIAAVLAAGGLDVMLSDVQPERLDESVAAARSAVAGRGGEVGGSADLARAVRGADLVVEAVVEDLAVKQEVFAAVSAPAPGAVLATNTSVLPVTAIAARAHHPERVLGTHWWNPPDLIPVVEVIPGRLTSAEVTGRVMLLLGHLGKTPVQVRRDVPGFIGNRLQHALWREAITLVADGICDADTVDLVARNTIGLRLARMGPIENADYVGLDLTLAIHDAVLPALSTDGGPSPLLRALVRRGDLGAKTGRGFLPWGPGSQATAGRELAAHVLAQTPSRTTRCAVPQTPVPQTPVPQTPVRRTPERGMPG
jgi:3-hydroxybutyryl-CoA dehydrogenase